LEPDDNRGNNVVSMITILIPDNKW
jgi:hypothetical protein